MSLTIATLVPLLLKTGPTILRTVGGLFGSGGKKAANTAAQLVETVAGLDPKAAEAELSYKLSQLPPEQLVALESMKIQLEKIQAEREQNRFHYEVNIHSQTQKTIRNGDKNGTDYVKETRPKLARLSTYAAIAYTFIFEGLAAGDIGDGAEIWILSALFTPALTYVGARSVDAFSKYKTGGVSNGRP